MQCLPADQSVGIEAEGHAPETLTTSQSDLYTKGTGKDPGTKGEEKCEAEESGATVHHEEVELRRSSRQRTVPRKLTYPTLGNPLVSVMHSILIALDQAFSQALVYDTTPYICQLEPLSSETV